MNEFQKILNNKTIAVVGPSPHLMGKNLGNKIDSYDIVCRLNELRPVGLEDDYGKKADVLFWHLNNCDKHEFMIQRDVDPLGFKNVQMLVYPRQHQDVNRRGCGTSTPLENATTWFPETPFYQTDTKAVKSIEDAYQAHLTVGTLSLLMILECNFKELYVCGMSFYRHTGNREGYRYHTSQPTQAHTRGEPHEIDKDIRCLRNFFKNRKNVSGDEYFKKIILQNNT